MRATVPACGLATLLFVSGCGNPGTPLPPSLHIPEPVTDLSAFRTSDTVTLHWTMTRRNTERLMLKGDQRAVVCRAIEKQPCIPVATLLVAAAEPASYDDVLPASLSTGTPHLLRYEVRLQSPKGRDAGPSNLVYAAAGAAPPALTSAKAEPTARGILIQWTGPSVATQPYAHGTLIARLQRDRVLRPGENAKPSKLETQNGVPQPLLQTLEAPEHIPADTTQPAPWTPDHTIDAQALLNRTYRYSVQLVERVSLGGHSLEIAGAPAQSEIVAAVDHFPPAIPTDLNAVANPDGRPAPSIDLSWSADSDADLAGYFVYRRDAAGGTPVRITGNTPVQTSAWSDTTARPGVRYSYSVSAVDSTGNESARSSETSEVLTAGDAPQP